MLITSTVWPDMVVTTSPGRWALPSRHILDQPADADDIGLGLALASAFIAPTTAPAPPMSHFIASMFWAGLIEMPPVSKVTPLPMKATGGSPARRRSTSGPAAGARGPSPGRRRAARPCRAWPSRRGRAPAISRPSALDALVHALDEALGINDVGRLGDQLAGQRDALDDRLHSGLLALLGPAPPPTIVTAVERRLLLVLEPGAVAVVAPAAQRRAQARPRRRVGVIAEAA